MNKYVLSLFFLLIAASVIGQKKPVNADKRQIFQPAAQKKSVVQLLSSETLEYVPSPGGKTITKVHKGVFKQDYSILRSDSAYYYADQNAVDAFGHVSITQGDTLHIYSDKLNYNGNTKVAILTDHVMMIDKDATLTTDYLTYNTATRIATYTGGGKLVNKDVKLVSKNGYYFSITRDAYFRYDVVCTTPDALIKTDTMRYNSGSRITYFYGPTHIYGKKDNDTLYTENGTYETIPEQAKFGKKNLYSQGTKSLKGDSLFYDRLKGYGRAVMHVTFNDNEQKTTLKGDLGEYYKVDERAVVTRNAYMILVTEDKDTTNSDSAAKVKPLPKTVLLNKKAIAKNKADSLMKKQLGLPQNGKAKAVNKPVVIPAEADSTIKKQLGLAPNTSLQQGILTGTVVAKADSAVKKQLGLPQSSNLQELAKPVITRVMTDTTLKKQMVLPPNTNARELIKGAVAAGKDKANASINGKADTALKAVKTATAGNIAGKATGPGKRDSLFLAADTLETQILTYKDLKILQKARFDANNRDTSIKVVYHLVLTKQPKVLTVEPPKMMEDTGFYHRNYFGKPRAKPVAKKKPSKPVDLKKLAADSVRNRFVTDSLIKVADHGLVDTSRIRIISGHHHAKLFKSDLQAKADSMFFSYSDSTIRMFNKPMIWTQGAQLSGDTIKLQMRKQKLDNMDLFPSALIVYIEKADSVHFNQIGGKTMHGIFRDNKLSSMAVHGNGETIAFKRDSATNIVTDMERSISNTIIMVFKNGELKRGSLISKTETNLYPIKTVKEDDKLLKAFTWKPKDRPVSKESIINTYKPPVTKKEAAPRGPVKGTMPIKSSPAKAGGKTPGASAGVKAVASGAPVIKSARDTSAIKSKPDSLKKVDTLKKIAVDTVKKVPVKKP